MYAGIVRYDILTVLVLAVRSLQKIAALPVFRGEKDLVYLVVLVASTVSQTQSLVSSVVTLTKSNFNICQQPGSQAQLYALCSHVID